VVAVAKAMSKATIKGLIFEVLPGALEDYRREQAELGNQEGIVRSRRLYYKVRTRYKNHPQRPRHREKYNPLTGELSAITYHYFQTNLLPAYQREYGEIPNLEHDPRGHMYEPHSGDRMELSTNTVKTYRIPRYQYNKVLYIEKEGQLDDMIPNRLAERFDMFICGGKGYATEASRDLLAIFGKEHHYDLYVMHDADPFGFNIAATLEEATARMPNHSIQVYDLGLSIDQARSLGGDFEPFTRKSALPQRILSRLTDEELEMFTGIPVDARHKAFEGQRIEIDSVSISNLINHIEEGILATGAEQKVMPPDSFAELTAESYRDVDIDNAVDEAIDEIIDRYYIQSVVREKVTDDVPLANLKAHIEKGYEADIHDSWRTIVSLLTEELVGDIQDKITEATKEALADYLSNEDDDEEW
jgi:hypothetical protein